MMAHRGIPPLLALALLAPAAAETASPAEPVVSDVEIEVTSEEGIELSALLSRREGAPATRPLVVLLHAMGRNRDGLLPLAESLAQAGFPALAVDMRGHGSSQRAGPLRVYSFKVVPPTDLHLVIDDLALMYRELEAEGLAQTTRIVFVGVGQGALVAAEAASRDPSVKALVIVDPPHDFAGFRLDRDLAYLGERPALFICSAMPSSEERALILSEYGHGPREIVKLDMFDTHDRLLAEETGAIEEITQWLTKRFPAPR